MSARNRRRRPAAGTRRRKGGTPGWALLLIGLAAGAAAVTSTIYIRDKLASRAAPDAQPAATRPAPRPTPRPGTAPAEKRFEFYEMLEEAEVVVPEPDADRRAGKPPAPLEAPGVYVLQAGSYAAFADADKVKARLALLGIRSQIQEISVDQRQFHRVRIGPIEDLDELNRNRTRLREAGIDFLVIRVGE